MKTAYLIIFTIAVSSTAVAQTSQDASAGFMSSTGCPLGKKFKPYEKPEPNKAGDMNKTDCMQGEDGVACYKRIHGIK